MKVAAEIKEIYMLKSFKSIIYYVIFKYLSVKCSEIK